MIKTNPPKSDGETSRRSLILGIASLVAAPAIVKASSLMDLRGYPMDPKVLAFRYNEEWIRSLLPLLNDQFPIHSRSAITRAEAYALVPFSETADREGITYWTSDKVQSSVHRRIFREMQMSQRFKT